MTIGRLSIAAIFAATLSTGSVAAQTQSSTAMGGTSMGAGMVSVGLVMPRMDPVEGMRLFASKGCVVCHSINGVGGTDAAALDASNMPSPMDPFDFVARMWRGAEPMVAMQKSELGAQIELTGQDLANIIAFVHDPAQQAQFNASVIPANIRAHLPAQN